MPQQEIPPSIRSFISRFIHTVEQLEILILLVRSQAVAWTAQKVYDRILTTPQSVERWLEELVRSGLLEKQSEPSVSYRCCSDESLLVQITALAEIYRDTPVRVIEAIYKREATAAQSFADAFKLKNTDQAP